MAHFAEVNANNIVIRVLVVENKHEHRGNEFLSEDLSLGGTWLQTSYNTIAGSHVLGGGPFRKNYANIGDFYDTERDAFIPPKPYDSWLLVEETAQWSAPKPYPNDSKDYYWEEESLEWVENIQELNPVEES
jgi:hypothetical protein